MIFLLHTWHCAGKSLNSRVSERDNSRAAVINKTGKTTVLPIFYRKEHGIALVGPKNIVCRDWNHFKL